MTGSVDPKVARASQFAHSILIEYVRGDARAIARLADDLALEDDPELTQLVLDRTLQVAVGLLVLVADRAGVNPRRAIDDAFRNHPPHPTDR